MTQKPTSEYFAFLLMTFTTITFAALVTFAAGASLPLSEPNGTDSLAYIRSVRPQKIIIDVDAGADDATALLLALAKPQAGYPEVIAITCTHGNTAIHNVVINVLKTLRVLKIKNIPVFMGAYGSLTTTPEGDDFYGKDGLGDVPDDDPPSLEEAQKEHAASAMVRLAAQYQGQVTVIATGPLTNIALAIRLDPHFRGNLHALFWMGGSVEGIGNIKPGIEFNAFMDPEANYITFNASGPPVITLSWETCIYHGAVNKQWRQNVLGKINSPSMNFLNAIEATTLQKNKWTACDAKAIAVLLDASIAVKAATMHVDISYQGDARGALLVDYKATLEPKNIVIIQEIDVEKFKTMCIENLS